MTDRLGRPCRRAASSWATAVATIVTAVFGAIGCARSSPGAAGITGPPGRQSMRPPAGGQPGTSPGTGAPSGSQSPGGGRTSPTRSPGGSPGTDPAGPAAALVPSAGAYLGAYVQPAYYTSLGEIAAVQSFQQSVGEPIPLVHTYHPWGNPFPNQADRYFVRAGKVLLLTWSGTPDTRKIIAGRYDAMIRARALAVKRLGRPILLEFRHEMDRPNLQWAVHGPKDYIAAWDHIRAIFTRAGATNVGWVWCPTGYGFGRGRAQPFYPGSNEVDWVCADIYSPSTDEPLQQVAQPFLRWAKGTGKPVLIGEFAVGNDPAGWPGWLLGAGALVGLDTQIKGIAYFDANGTDSNGRPFRYWLGGNAPALRAFADLLTWQDFHPVRRSHP